MLVLVLVLVLELVPALVLLLGLVLVLMALLPELLEVALRLFLLVAEVVVSEVHLLHFLELAELSLAELVALSVLVLAPAQLQLAPVFSPALARAAAAVLVFLGQAAAPARQQALEEAEESTLAPLAPVLVAAEVTGAEERAAAEVVQRLALAAPVVQVQVQVHVQVQVEAELLALVPLFGAGAGAVGNATDCSEFRATLSASNWCVALIRRSSASALSLSGARYWWWPW